MNNLLVKTQTSKLFIISQVLVSSMMILSQLKEDIPSIVLFGLLFMLNGIVHDN